IYQKLQGLQSFFNPPTSPPDITVGSLNAQTGKWTGMPGVITSEEVEAYNDAKADRDDREPGAKPRPVRLPPKPVIKNQTVYINGTNASVTLNCRNRSA